MKNLQLTLIVSSLLLFTTFSVFAQTSASNQQRVAAKNTANNPKANNDYMGLDAKIKNWMISGQIPASFPKYVSGQSDTEYKKIIKRWGANNLSLIKKEFHTKFTTKKRPTTTDTNNK